MRLAVVVCLLVSAAKPQKQAAPPPQPKVLAGHEGKVTGVAFSADGKLLVSAGEDRTVRLWDAASGAQKKSSDLEYPVWQLTPAPDGSSAALAGGKPDDSGRAFGNVQLVSLTTGEPGAIAESGPLFYAAGFSADGKLLATINDRGEAEVSDAKSGASKLSLDGYGHGTATAFSPDGKLVAFATDNRVDLVAVDGGKVSATVKPGALALAFAPNGKTLALAGPNGQVRLVDPAAGKVLRTLGTEAGKASAVAFGKDGKQLFAAVDGALVQFDADKGGPARATVATGVTAVTAFALAADGKQAAIAGDKLALVPLK